MDASHNALTALPDALGNLPALADLAVGHNALAALPATFVQLAHLRSLDLRHNKVASLPPDLLATTAVATLVLEGNPLTDAQLVDLPGYDKVGKRNDVRKKMRGEKRCEKRDARKRHENRRGGGVCKRTAQADDCVHSWTGGTHATSLPSAASRWLTSSCRAAPTSSSNEHHLRRLTKQQTLPGSHERRNNGEDDYDNRGRVSVATGCDSARLNPSLYMEMYSVLSSLRFRPFRRARSTRYFLIQPAVLARSSGRYLFWQKVMRRFIDWIHLRVFSSFRTSRENQKRRARRTALSAKRARLPARSACTRVAHHVRATWCEKIFSRAERS